MIACGGLFGERGAARRIRPFAFCVPAGRGAPVGVSPAKGVRGGAGRASVADRALGALLAGQRAARRRIPTSACCLSAPRKNRIDSSLLFIKK